MNTERKRFFSEYFDRCKSRPGNHDFIDDKDGTVVAISCKDGKVTHGEIFVAIYDPVRDVNTHLKVHDYIPP